MQHHSSVKVGRTQVNHRFSNPLLEFPHSSYTEYADHKTLKGDFSEYIQPFQD